MNTQINNSPLEQYVDKVFDEDGSAWLTNGTNPGTTGKPVYLGYEQNLTSGPPFVRANDNNGLFIRWNDGVGTANDQASAMFLWKKEDFENGKDTEDSVIMGMGGDTVSGQFSNFNTTFGTATLRFVLKDETNWYISNVTETLTEPPGLFSFEATDLGYSIFSPEMNTVGPPTWAAGTIGAAVTTPPLPTFQGITWVGIRIDAVRGAVSPSDASASLGVKSLTIEAR